tara:strand:- start:117505 stop:117987 length:483 start_codon:yes stop_codon:yes gene_type:complete
MRLRTTGLSEHWVGIMNVRGTYTLCRRETLRFKSVWLQTILGPVISVLLFVVVFAAALGRADIVINGSSYVAFIVPGLVLMAMLQNAFANMGFTTITNSGAEVVNPHRNIGRAIIISILICLIVYLLVAFGVGANLPLPEIVAARDFALAEASRPVLGAQ